MLDSLNAYFTAEKAGEDTERMLSPESTDVAQKLLALKEAKGKIHDKSLVPEKIGFAI